MPEEKRRTEDRFTVLVLWLLGHRWPKQIEAGELVPEWADSDGVIPIGAGFGEKTLLERVRQRIPEELQESNPTRIEREFEEIVGTTLDRWLAGSFFKRHISQFKKRPIAWQLESRRSTKSPKSKVQISKSSRAAFSCLCYYHELDLDLLPKIRSQYVGPLRTRYETELRTLEGIAHPTPDQSGRKIQLDNWIDELKTFDQTLNEVSSVGFGPGGVLAGLRQFAIDDATLCLKSRWLRRLAEAVQSGPLEDWIEMAADSGLHSELPEWIRKALTHLHHHCSAVGPKSPDLLSLPREPDSAQLSAIICQNPAAMAKEALVLACDVWWGQLNETVLVPLRRQISERNEAIKRLREEPTVARTEKRVDPDGQNLISVLHTLYTGDRDFKRDIDAAMRAAFGDDFEELVFPPAADQRIQLRVRWKPLKREQSAADLSDGTLRFLFLLTVLASPSPAPVIAIDEPETGLHPSMLPIVAEYAVDAALRSQVILTTHSPQFLDAFTETQPTTTVAKWTNGESVLHT